MKTRQRNVLSQSVVSEADSSKLSLNFQQTIWCDISEENNLDYYDDSNRDDRMGGA
jgi:hypothetical protein